MDRGAWWATVHGVTKSWTRLPTHAGTHMPYDPAVTLYKDEKHMTTQKLVQEYFNSVIYKKPPHRKNLNDH